MFVDVNMWGRMKCFSLLPEEEEEIRKEKKPQTNLNS